MTIKPIITNTAKIENKHIDLVVDEIKTEYRNSEF